MPKRVAVIQSNYIPWKGYFDIIHDVDEFIFYDDVQYTRGAWRNRNRIKTARGPSWLTIPVGPDENRLICDVRLPATSWQAKHWQRLLSAYEQAPFFAQLRPLLEEIYQGQQWRLLSDWNQHLIRAVAGVLGIRTRFRDSREFTLTGRKQERLVGLLRQSGCDVYVSGPAARDYIDRQRFADAGIEVIWKDYDGYPEYPQFHPPFLHQVTVLDLLVHTGPQAPHYIWGWREGGPPEGD